jgi:SAM-dependent methyltransferase
MSTTKAVKGSAEVQGKLWGARADDWAQYQEPLSAPLFERVLDVAGVGPRTQYLDLGTASGIAASFAARRGARVSGLDASTELIEIARGRVPEGDFRVGEIEDLPYADGTFDVVTGFNSFQYATQPVEAIREAARVTKPGGIVVAAVWGREQDCEAVAILRALASQLPPPPPGAPGPFALSADGALEALLREAGIEPFATEDVPTPWSYDSRETAVRAHLSSGPAARAIEHSGERSVREAIAAVIAPFALPDGGYELRNSFRFVAARVQG